MESEAIKNKRSARVRKIMWGICAVLGIPFLGMFAWLIMSASGEMKETKSLKENVKVFAFIRQDPSSAFYSIDGEVKNNSPKDIWDIKINCKQVSASGTVVNDTTKTFYQKIIAGQHWPLENFSMGFSHPQANVLRCSIEDFNHN